MSKALPAAARNASREVVLERVEDYFAGTFQAMASPCTLLVDSDDRDEAAAALRTAEAEANRIETKFSRYRLDNPVHAINHSGGRPIQVDEETALLLDYAHTCYELSDGMFDITSGVLRRVWTFDGGSRTPPKAAIRRCLALVGWERVTWERPELTLPAGMELDFGGIGKEYAVDRAAALIGARIRSPYLVNFGGDLFVSGARRGGRSWAVGIDDPDRPGDAALLRLEVERGGIATSGDARRFVLWRGKRLGHILDPRTGWPVEDAPRSVTVVGRNCMEAGTLATLAYLQGAGAGEYLEEQDVLHWIVPAL